MRRTVATPRERFAAAAAGLGAPARIPVEVRVAVDDPFRAYRRARDGNRSGGFFLETGGSRSGWGYFAVAPSRRVQVGADATALDRGSPSLAALDGALDGERLRRAGCDVPYPCGLFGWLSYDTAREFESVPASTRDDRGLPHLECGVYDRVAAWESPQPAGDVTLRVTACPRVRPADDPTAAYERGRDAATNLARRAVEGDPAVCESPADAPAARFESDCGPAAFADRVRAVKAHIERGETFQANVSHRLVAPAAVHPVEAYAALREVNPAPYAGLLECRSIDLVSASPELLVQRAGDRLLTEPIAGTRPRGDSARADAAHERDLRGDEKERAEHAMLVDLARNDLGKACAYGSVDVEEYRRVDRYAEVMHLVSVVAGRLREGATTADAVRAVFPGGTVTGAPKPRTLGIIDETEATRRGPYTGSVFALGFDERATLNILIRTLVCHGGEYHLRVGAGIVHDSDPAREYEETLAKGRALVRAVDAALDGPSMTVAEPGRPDSAEAGTNASVPADAAAETASRPADETGANPPSPPPTDHPDPDGGAPSPTTPDPTDQEGTDG